MVYLFIGQDSLSKDLQLKKLRQEFLPKSTEQFNLDILYAKDLSLKGLQEKFLSLPVGNPKRIIVIKNAQDLKDDSREFLSNYVLKPYPQLVLVLDISNSEKNEAFVRGLSKHSQVVRFKEVIPPNTFTLSRFIQQRKADLALHILKQLLDDGEKPERILGGLRYVWEKDPLSPLESRRRLKLLLNCDIDIKKGRLKPAFALEKLVISLCGFAKPFG